MQVEQQLAAENTEQTRAAELFWLDLMLTGDALHAEGAMLSAISCDDDLPDLTVDSSKSSLRRFVEQALRSVWSELTFSIGRFTSAPAENSSEPPLSALQDLDSERLQQAVLQIDTFPRCVLVLRLFGKMSIAEINSFLKVNKQLLQQAFACGVLELTRNLASGDGAETSLA